MGSCVESRFDVAPAALSGFQHELNRSLVIPAWSVPNIKLQGAAHCAEVDPVVVRDSSHNWRDELVQRAVDRNVLYISFDYAIQPAGPHVYLERCSLLFNFLFINSLYIDCFPFHILYNCCKILAPSFLIMRFNSSFFLLSSLLLFQVSATSVTTAAVTRN